VAKAGGGGFGISYERAVGKQAFSDASGNGPYPHTTLLAKCRFLYDFQGVFFFMANNRYTAIAGIDKLFESFDIVHCMLPRVFIYIAGTLSGT
jgi:hypothetical protein